MPRTFLTSLIPAAVIATAWLRLEHPISQPLRSVAVAVLAVLPALVRPIAARALAILVSAGAAAVDCLRRFAVAPTPCIRRDLVALLRRLPRLLRRADAVRPARPRRDAERAADGGLRLRAGRCARGGGAATGARGARVPRRCGLACDLARSFRRPRRRRAHPARRARRPRRTDEPQRSACRRARCGGARARSARCLNLVRGCEERPRLVAALGLLQRGAAAGQRLVRVERAVRGHPLPAQAHTGPRSEGAPAVALLARSRPRQVRRRSLDRGAAAAGRRARAARTASSSARTSRFSRSRTRGSSARACRFGTTRAMRRSSRTCRESRSSHPA